MSMFRREPPPMPKDIVVPTPVNLDDEASKYAPKKYQPPAIAEQQQDARDFFSRGLQVYDNMQDQISTLRQMVEQLRVENTVLERQAGDLRVELAQSKNDLAMAQAETAQAHRECDASNAGLANIARICAGFELAIPPVVVRKRKLSKNGDTNGREAQESQESQGHSLSEPT